LVRGTGVVVDGKHHNVHSWAWKNSGCNNNSITKRRELVT
jgi:hypothetical protein